MTYEIGEEVYCGLNIVGRVVLVQGKLITCITDNGETFLVYSPEKVVK